MSFYRQSAGLFMDTGQLRHEGAARNNLANTLTQLGKYEEARLELQRAIECKQAFGLEDAPWLTWHFLHDLEQASGNIAAARLARQQALEAYLTYRRDGRESQQSSSVMRLCRAVEQSMQQGNTAEIEQVIRQSLESEEEAKNFLHKLQAIIAGERDLALAEDEGLRFDLAAELLLLLEGLREAGI